VPNTKWHTLTGSTAEIVFDLRKRTRAEWLEGRTHGIGGSEVSTILKINPWDSPVALWLRKKERIDAVEMNESMYWGLIHESNILKEMQKLYPEFWIINCNYFLRHPQIAHHVVTPDGIIIADGNPQGNGVLEMKTTGIECFREKWTDEPPDYVNAQVQWQMHVTGLKWGMVALLAGGNRFQSYYVARDDDFIAYAVGEVDKFWKLLVDNIQPPLDGTEATYNAIKGKYPKEDEELIDLELDPLKYGHLFIEYDTAKENEKLGASNKRLATAQLMELTQEHQRARCGGAVIHWRTNKNGTRVPSIKNPIRAMNG